MTGSIFYPPKRRNQVWSYDFVDAQTHDGRSIRLLPIIYKYTPECLAIRIARSTNGIGVIDTMTDVMLIHGVPEHIRSDYGPEMTAKIVLNWLAQVGADVSPKFYPAWGRVRA